MTHAPVLPQGFGQYTPWFQPAATFGLFPETPQERADRLWRQFNRPQFPMPQPLSPVNPVKDPVEEQRRQDEAVRKLQEFLGKTEFQQQIEKHLDQLRQLPHDPPNPFDEQQRRLAEQSRLQNQAIRDAQEAAEELIRERDDLRAALLIPPLSAAPRARHRFFRFCRRFARWVERLVR